MRVPGWDYRLPAVPKPFHLETIDSYISGLAHANRIDPADLHESARRNPETGLAKGKSDAWKPVNVSLWTGLPVDHFHANASMAYASAYPVSPHDYRAACSHCSHRRVVWQYTHYFYNVCVKHRRWLRHGYNAQRTVDETTVRAEIRYQRLIRGSIRHRPLAFRILTTVQEDVQRRLRRMDYGAGTWERLLVASTAVWSDKWKVEEENETRQAIAQYPMLVDLLAISVSRPILAALTFHIPAVRPHDYLGMRRLRERCVLDCFYEHPIRSRLGHGDWLVLNELPRTLHEAVDGWSDVACLDSVEVRHPLPTRTWPSARPRRGQQWYLAERGHAGAA